MDTFTSYLFLKRKEKKVLKKKVKKIRGGRGVEETHHMDFADNYLAVTFRDLSH